MWEDKAAALRGDLLDLIRIKGEHDDITQAMAVARAFLEAQLRQQHKMSYGYRMKL